MRPHQDIDAKWYEQGRQHRVHEDSDEPEGQVARADRYPREARARRRHQELQNDARCDVWFPGEADVGHRPGQGGHHDVEDAQDQE